MASLHMGQPAQMTVYQHSDIEMYENGQMRNRWNNTCNNDFMKKKIYEKRSPWLTPTRLYSLNPSEGSPGCRLWESFLAYILHKQRRTVWSCSLVKRMIRFCFNRSSSCGPQGLRAPRARGAQSPREALVPLPWFIRPDETRNRVLLLKIGQEYKRDGKHMYMYIFAYRYGDLPSFWQRCFLLGMHKVIIV